ncbi:MAG: Rrf2 family transcriptional regulator [Deltaproteobacteria bacterium]|nr:Rrf2 family transcriptional regulator [Deltaproteobacteria bacterium]
MLQITRDGEYAVRAVLFLASQPEGKISLINEISEAQEVPKSYLSKIMQHLTRSGLVKSRRGAKGGFVIGRPADTITLRETIEAVEGPIFLNVCLIKKGECHRDVFCPVHPVWKEAQKRLFEVLDSKTMADLVKDASEIEKSNAEDKKHRN